MPTELCGVKGVFVIDNTGWYVWTGLSLRTQTSPRITLPLPSSSTSGEWSGYGVSPAEPSVPLPASKRAAGCSRPTEETAAVAGVATPYSKLTGEVWAIPLGVVSGVQDTTDPQRPLFKAGRWQGLEQSLKQKVGALKEHQEVSPNAPGPAEQESSPGPDASGSLAAHEKVTKKIETKTPQQKIA